jgi:hypothetical protein
MQTWNIEPFVFPLWIRKNAVSSRKFRTSNGLP